jgi:DNA-binding transcriptional regulator YiaG
LDHRERFADRIDDIRARHPQLDSHVAAVWADLNPRNEVYHGTLLSCLARTDDIAQSEVAAIWSMFTHHVLPTMTVPDRVIRSAVYANSIALLAAGAPEDFGDFVDVVEQAGALRVASIQSRLDQAFGSQPGLPLATALTRTMARWNRVESLLIDAGRSPRGALRGAQTVYQGAHFLLMADVTPGQSAPLLRSADELRFLVDHGNVDLWRRQLSAVAAGPWGPHGERLLKFADEADLPAVKLSVDQAIRHYKKTSEKAEKDAVAREIHELIRGSGVTQRNFARYVGTSASRLSTYATGVVTPSAAMMLRIRRTAQALGDADNVAGEATAARRGRNARGGQSSTGSAPTFDAPPQSLLDDLDDDVAAN